MWAGVAQIGQTVIIRAAVNLAPAGRQVAQGNIAFTANGEAIPHCEALWVYMSANAAECKTTFPKAGTYRIAAEYGGTSAYDPSSAAMDLEVGKLDPWAYLAFLPPTPVYGAGVLVNALVLGAKGMPDPTGTFTFREGGAELVTRLVQADGRAPLDLPLAAGRHTIEAVYNGDDLYLASRPVTISLNIGKGPPIVAISSTPAQLRQPVTITASVVPSGSGTMTFTGVPGCANVPVSDGLASCGVTFAQLGTVTVGAEYSGDSNLTAAATSMKLTVGRVVAGVYVAVFPPAPVYGQTVQVGALALGAPGVAPPTGTVTFGDALGGAGAGVLDAGGHTVWTSTPPAGVRVYTATYNGDANYGTSQGIASVTVAKAATSTKLTAAAGGSLTASVTVVAPGAGVPTGVVRFTRDGNGIGTATLVGGVATLDGGGVAGNWRAEYTGDLNFVGSVSATLAVSAPRVDLRITADRNPAPAGPVTLAIAATPNPGTTAPAGTVQVTVDGAAAGSAALTGGAARVTVDLAPGSHAITASYGGDSVYPAATASMTLAVTQPAGTLALTANPQSPVYGEPITLTAQLPAGAAGKVTFSDGLVPLGIVDGPLTLSRLAAGAHAIAESWAGDANWGAASAQLALTVAKAQTATALTVSGGQAAARVTVVEPGAGAPSGSVRFVDGVTGADLAVVPLDGGTASTPLPAGVPLVVARYEGDLNFAASASAAAGLLTVSNAASYASAVFAPDEMVTLFGAGLTGAAKVADSAGVLRGADLLYATASQASLVLPEGLADGAATLSVAGMSASLTIGRAAPGLFTMDASGHGPPAGQLLRVHADGTQESGAPDVVDAGAEGDTVYLILYGTGLRHAAKVVCTAGGRAAPVLFAGPQGGASGLDQLNVLLPAELKAAGRVDVVVTADGVASNTVSLVFR
jgi:uncharacterized protein (TIGR03437 family)